MFWKNGLSKKFAPEHDLFCNIWKDGISFFQKIKYFFFRRKMKEHDPYQKTHGNMIFLYTCTGVTGVALPSWQKDKDAQKNTPQDDISGITAKDDIHPIFILDTSYFCWNTIFIDTAQEATTGYVLREKGALRDFTNSQGKTCSRASFLIKVQN